MNSIEVNRKCCNQAEVMFVDVTYPSYVICIFVPELSGTNSDALANVLANDALNQELISLVLAKILKLSFDFVSNILSGLINLIWCHDSSSSLKFLMNDFLDSLLCLTWSKLILELWSDLISLLTLLCVLFIFTHFSKIKYSYFF